MAAAYYYLRVSKVESLVFLLGLVILKIHSVIPCIQHVAVIIQFSPIMTLILNCPHSSSSFDRWFLDRPQTPHFPID